MATLQKLEKKIQRLDKFAEYKNLNDNQLTKECKLAVGTLGKSRKEGKDLSRRSCENILNRFPELNRSWFLTGVGEMLITDVPTKYESYPLIDTAVAECGKAFGDMHAIMEADCPRIVLPGVPSATDFFVKASGYSMVNTSRPELSIPPGAYVGLSRLNNSFIRWGEVYALATTDGIMIKKLLQDESNQDLIRCLSYNSEEYPEFSISKNDVFDYAKITCVIPVMVR